MARTIKAATPEDVRREVLASIDEAIENHRASLILAEADRFRSQGAVTALTGLKDHWETLVIVSPD